MGSPPGGGVTLCAYKLCRIEVVDLPLMKDGVEELIVDLIRISLLEAATQAWVWQDEWHDLNVQVCRSSYRWNVVNILQVIF